MRVPILPVSQERLRIVFGSKTTATVTARGFVCNNLNYFSAEVADLCSTYREEFKNCTVKYDPSDLGECFLLHPVTNTFLIVKCTDYEYAKGLSIETHQATVAANAEAGRACNTRELRQTAGDMHERLDEIRMAVKRRGRPKTVTSSERAAAIANEAGDLGPRSAAASNAESQERAREARSATKRMGSVDDDVPTFPIYRRAGT